MARRTRRKNPSGLTWLIGVGVAVGLGWYFRADLIAPLTPLIGMTPCRAKLLVRRDAVRQGWRTPAEAARLALTSESGLEGSQLVRGDGVKAAVTRDGTILWG